MGTRITAERAQLSASDQPGNIERDVAEIESVALAALAGAGSGLQTGGKAIVNGTATAVRQTATLGLYDDPWELISVTDEDRAGGYGVAFGVVNVSANAIISLSPGAIANCSKGTKFAKAVATGFAAYDTAGNVVSTGSGIYDATKNGLNLQNGTQILMGGVGLTGNIAAVRNLKNCFPAGTPVATSDGLRPIESIRAGDRVWAFDHVAGKWVLKDVLANFVHDDYHADLVHVTVGGDTIQGTMLHPFWVISGKDLDERTIRSHLEQPPEGSQIPGRWVDATDLKIGDQLLLRDGSQGVIENVRHEHVNTTVYNFAVADLRCYAVGQHQILVHNMCGEVGGSNAPSKVTTPNAAARAKKEAPNSGGIVAQNGTRIGGYAKHGIDRAIGDGASRAGTSPSAILDALKNPSKITSGVDKLGRPFEIFTGNNARVVVNPQTGKIISVNPLGRGGVR